MISATFTDPVLEIEAGLFSTSITVEQISRTWDALSHFPDRRARLELAWLAERLNAAGARIAGLVEGGADINATHEAERFAIRHVSLTRRMWAAESGCMSWFIVGPARFPVERNAKRQRARDTAAQAVRDHVKAAMEAIERKAWPHGHPDGPIRMSNPDAIPMLRARIESRRNAHARMKATNEAIRRAKTEDEAALADAVRGATGMSETNAAKIVQKDCFGIRGFASFSLSGELAEIKRLEARVAALEKNQARGTVETSHNTTAGALEIVENAEAGRIQLVFPDKPEASVRDILKRNGFRWAPSNGAWQRHLNNAGRYAARQVLAALQKDAA